MVHGVNCMKDRERLSLIARRAKRGPDIDWAVRCGRAKVRGGHPNEGLCIVDERRSLFIVTRRLAAGGGAAAADDAVDAESAALVGLDKRFVATTTGGVEGGLGTGFGLGSNFGGQIFLMPLTTFGFSCSTSGRVAAVSELQDLQEPRKFSAQVGLRCVGFRSDCDSSGQRREHASSCALSVHNNERTVADNLNSTFQ